MLRARRGRSDIPLGEIYSSRGDRGTSTILSAAGTRGHCAAGSQGSIISCGRTINQREYSQDGRSIVRYTVTNSTIILDVPEDLVAGGVRVVSRDSLMLDLFKPIWLIRRCLSFT